MEQNLAKKPVILGLIAGIVLLGFYFLSLSFLQSFSHALSQFSQMWYWILLLIAGFGLQIGLYVFIRGKIQEKHMKSPTTAVVTSGTISTGSMIACCLHHLVDVLPILGLAATSLFLIKYQILFILIGILSNLIGITLMLEIIQKNNLAEGFLKKILIFNMQNFKKVILSAFVIIFLATIFLISNSQKLNSPGKTIETAPETILDLPTEFDSQGGISFEVTPLDFSFGKPLKFDVKINTHAGSLDFDLTKISILEDDKGNKYQPLDWQGSPPGGHHREGVLLFPKLDNQTKKLKLIIEDNSLRTFEWDL